MPYDRDGAPAFAFDMMEPERPKVDRAVLSFLKSEALHPADFTIREDGVVSSIRSWRGGWRRSRYNGTPSKIHLSQDALGSKLLTAKQTD